MNVDFSQIITQIFAFMIMYWVLKKYGWIPLMRLLDDRKAFIKSEFDTIQAEKENAVSLSEEYEEKLRGIEAEARIRIQEVIKQGKVIADEMRENAQKDAKNILSQTKKEIDREFNIAKNQLKEDVVGLVMMATEKVLDIKMDKEHDKKLVEDFVKGADLNV